MEINHKCLYGILLIVLGEHSKVAWSVVQVAIDAPPVVNVTQPFTVTCRVNYGDSNPNDVNLISMWRGDKKLSENGGSAPELSNDLCKRYEVKGEHQADKNTVAITLHVTAAFSEDAGYYNCTAFVRGLKATPTPHPAPLFNLKVNGNQTLEDEYRQACIPTTTSSLAKIETTPGDPVNAASRSAGSRSDMGMLPYMCLALMVTLQWLRRSSKLYSF